MVHCLGFPRLNCWLHSYPRQSLLLRTCLRTVSAPQGSRVDVSICALSSMQTAMWWNRFLPHLQGDKYGVFGTPLLHWPIQRILSFRLAVGR